MYQVLARKWRPQSFEEMVGQEHVARTLRNAIRSNRLAHAYIFAGLRGTGKTTAARILAKCLNCEKGPTPTPCSGCVPCLEIAEGRSMDVLEMDAASRTGVDNIRELQEVVSYAPVRDRYRVLIIDEAHMLSKAASNALLKTLEEPPPRVVFVLATTEIQKILPTIFSRCQVFEFRRVTAREVAAHLSKVCEAENVTISGPTLERIARAGEGSVRDSLSVLECVLAFCGSSVLDEDALQVLGAVRTEVLVAMVGALARRDAAGMLRVLDGLADEGHDLVHFWSELIGALRDLLILRTVSDRTDLVRRSEEEAEALRAASEGLSREDLTRVFQILADLEPALKSSSQPRFLFEATLIRLAGLGSVRSVEEILATLGRQGSNRGTEPRIPLSRRAGPAEPRSPQKKKGGESVIESRGKAAGPPAQEGDRLAAFRLAVQGVKPMLDAILDQAAVLAMEGDVLTVGFGSGSGSLRRQLEREENRTVLRRCAEQVSGRPVDILVQEDLESPAPPPGESRPLRSAPWPETGGRAGSPTGSTPSRGPVDREALLKRAESEPGIKKLLTTFGAQVVDIRPLQSSRDLVADSPDAGPVEESS